MQRFMDSFVSGLVSVVFDGVIVHDGERITDANERAAGIFGFENAEAMLGLPYQELLSPRGRERAESRVKAATEGYYSAVCRRQDGTEFTVDVNACELATGGRRARIVALRYGSIEDDLTGEAALQRSMALDQTVKALASTIEQRDAFTGGHQNRVSALATRIGGGLGMSERELVTIRIAGNIHDIGKISVPAEILMKPGSLSRQEYDLVKLHPATGAAIVNSVDFDGPVHEIILQHHERLDGSGYPLGISDPVPEARVIAVADVYDAMTSSRPYRAGMAPADAIERLETEEAGRMDPHALAGLKQLVLPQEGR